jgi:endonuclease/exonuclease/phosphatase family metal-dependent hydrolase
MRLALIGALCLAQAPHPAQDGVPLRVLTFNIRYDEPADGLEAWPLRRDDVAGLVRFHRPDVAGLQEVLAHQRDELLERLPGYEVFGEGRDGRDAGEHCSVLYRPERLELLDQQTFWLSDTPDRPGAAWGAGLSRICTWGLFRERATGQGFSLWNVHLDHRSQEARENSARLLVARIGARPQSEPVVLLGDFNCTEDSRAYLTLVQERLPDRRPLVDTIYAACEPGYGPSGTFTGFGHGERAGPRIDHVLVGGPLRVERHAVLSDTTDGRTPSDHRPVLADLTLGVPFDQPRLELRSGWRVRLDPAGDLEGLEQPGVDDADWPTLVSGEAWELQGQPDYDGVAWYRRRVVVPAAWRGAGVHLTWGETDDLLALWVNGEVVLPAARRTTLRHTYAVRLPAGLLRFGRENLLAFRVESPHGPGGLTEAPVALERDRATSTHWAARFRSEALLDEVLWSASAEEQTFPFEVTDEGDAGAYLDLRAMPIGGSGVVEVRLVAPDGETTLARRERNGLLRLELRVDRPGSWAAVVDDRRGGEAAGRLRVVLRDA